MACLSREERQQLVERENGALPISTQAHLLGLNRSGLYYHPVPPSAREVALMHRIDEIYTAHPYYGYRSNYKKRSGLITYDLSVF